jgi:hypothetical protein
MNKKIQFARPSMMVENTHLQYFNNMVINQLSVSLTKPEFEMLQVYAVIFI